MPDIEILSPAGDMERLEAAIKYGADAVYLGGKAFGMRANPSNFNMDDLAKGCKKCHENGVKVYMTVNTLPREYELAALPQFLIDAQNAGIDAIIAADLGVLAKIKEIIPNMEVHMSTQFGIVNSETCNFLYKLGVKRAVLARELSLEEIKQIRKNIPSDMELETFVHGAMCVSFSGRCLISAYLTNRDANRGECAQPCRWKYYLSEEKRPGVYFPIEEDDKGTYFFNAKDLCMIDHVPELIDAGITSLKIEGRAKSAYYTSVTTNAYAMAKKYALEGKPLPQWVKDEVYKCSHRQYCTGFFYGWESPGENYETSGYERSYDIVAVVDHIENGKLYAVQRNRFFVHDELEILEPGKKPFSIKPENLYDENGAEITQANHAMMKFSFDYSGENICNGAIIRKKS